MYAELTRKCKKCGVIKAMTEFHKNGYRRKDGTSGLRHDCKSCSHKIHDAYVTNNRSKINADRRDAYHNLLTGVKAKITESGLRMRYNLTMEQYNKLLLRQDNKCAICKSDQNNMPRKFDVDHCHKSGKIRGLLCIRCNRGIGLLKDDPKILRSALRYLAKSKN